MAVLNPLQVLAAVDKNQLFGAPKFDVFEL